MSTSTPNKGNDDNLWRIALVAFFILGLYRLFQGREIVAIIFFAACYFIFKRLEARGPVFPATTVPAKPVQEAAGPYTNVPQTIQKPRLMDAAVLSALKEPPLSPIQVEPKNLRRGYIFDYDMKTWTVKDMKLIYHLDEGSGAHPLEKDVIVENGLEQYNLRFERDGTSSWIPFSRKINPYTLDAAMDQYRQSGEVLLPSVLDYQDEKFFRERTDKGYYITPEDNSYQHLITTRYFNENKTKTLRIDLLNKRDWLCWAGTLVPANRFTNLLPPV